MAEFKFESPPLSRRDHGSGSLRIAWRRLTTIPPLTTTTNMIKSNCKVYSSIPYQDMGARDAPAYICLLTTISCRKLCSALLALSTNAGLLRTRLSPGTAVGVHNMADRCITASISATALSTIEKTRQFGYTSHCNYHGCSFRFDAPSAAAAVTTLPQIQLCRSQRWLRARGCPPGQLFACSPYRRGGSLGCLRSSSDDQLF